MLNPTVRHTQFDVTILPEQNVVTFDIPVDDFLCMKELQGLKALWENNFFQVCLCVCDGNSKKGEMRMQLVRCFGRTECLAVREKG